LLTGPDKVPVAFGLVAMAHDLMKMWLKAERGDNEEIQRSKNGKY